MWLAATPQVTRLRMWELGSKPNSPFINMSSHWLTLQAGHSSLFEIWPLFFFTCLCSTEAGCCDSWTWVVLVNLKVQERLLRPLNLTDPFFNSATQLSHWGCHWLQTLLLYQSVFPLGFNPRILSVPLSIFVSNKGQRFSKCSSQALLFPVLLNFYIAPAAQHTFPPSFSAAFYFCAVAMHDVTLGYSAVWSFPYSGSRSCQGLPCRAVQNSLLSAYQVVFTILLGLFCPWSWPSDVWFASSDSAALHNAYILRACCNELHSWWQHTVCA